MIWKMTRSHLNSYITLQIDNIKTITLQIKKPVLLQSDKLCLVTLISYSILPILYCIATPHRTTSHQTTPYHASFTYGRYNDVTLPLTGTPSAPVPNNIILTCDHASIISDLGAPHAHMDKRIIVINYQTAPIGTDIIRGCS
jgi:hypothetical protein